MPTGIALEFPGDAWGSGGRPVGAGGAGRDDALAGVIDPGYRGEIKVVVTNLSAVAVEVKVGDRIAQLRIVHRIEAEFEEVTELAEAPRGAAGFLGVREARGLRLDLAQRRATILR